MKNNYLKICLMAVSSLLFYSCKKDFKTPAEVTNGEKHLVQFNVSGFKQQIKDINTASVKSESINQQLDMIYYLVYDSKGVEVSRIIQDYSSENFGNISDSLNSGTYTIVVMGVKGSSSLRDGKLIINKNRYEATPVKLDLPKAHFDVFYDIGGNYRTDDIFYKKFKTSVGGDNVKKEVTLERIVGALEIILEDAIPAKASYITVTVENEFSQFDFEYETLSNSIKEELYKKLNPSDKGKLNTKINTFIFNTDALFSVTIRCFNEANELISERIIEELLVNKNKKLILSGKLFDNKTPGSKNVNIIVNETMDPEFKTVKF